ncbi:hypothetical protein BKP30_27270 [Rhodococcus erythropolis]|nr:hypothetical protein BKP30_27270 [Rhodococcus erythropolis]
MVNTVFDSGSLRMFGESRSGFAWFLSCPRCSDHLLVRRGFKAGFGELLLSKPSGPLNNSPCSFANLTSSAAAAAAAAASAEGSVVLSARVFQRRHNGTSLAGHSLSARPETPSKKLSRATIRRWYENHVVWWASRR